MRQLIAGFKMSIGGQIEGPEGYADRVAAWSEEYGLTPQIDGHELQFKESQHLQDGRVRLAYGSR